MSSPSYTSAPPALKSPGGEPTLGGVELLGTVRILAQNPLLQAMAVLLAALVAARLADWLLGHVLTRLVARTATRIDDEIVSLLSKPVHYTLLLAGPAFLLLLYRVPPRWAAVASGTIKTTLVLIWLVFLIRLALLLIEWMTGHPDRFQMVQPATRPLFEILSRVVLFGGALYFLFLSWHIDVTAWLASAGIVGVAVGFAARDTLANLFAGVFILADAPYRIGDYIVLDGGERGRVTQIGMRSTRILTRDDVEITIPNSTIANSKIRNESGGPTTRSRLGIPVGVAYGSSIEEVRRTLMAVAQEGIRQGEVCAQPEPRVRFRAFGESSLDFELLCWIRLPEQRGRVRDYLNCRVYEAFEKAGITIPFPQRDVHLPEGGGART